MKIIIGSNNQGKIKEVRSIIKGVEIFSLEDFDINIDIVEDKTTLEENSLKKAEEIYDYILESNLIEGDFYVISDDSGLFIEALNWEPGVYTKRYSGGSDKENNLLIIEKLEGENNRYAEFRTVVTIVGHNDYKEHFLGVLEGDITEEEIGENGFAFDTIFKVRPIGKTLAEIDDNFKNKISARAKALKLLNKKINKSN